MLSPEKENFFGSANLKARLINVSLKYAPLSRHILDLSKNEKIFREILPPFRRTAFGDLFLFSLGKALILFISLFPKLAKELCRFTQYPVAEFQGITNFGKKFLKNFLFLKIRKFRQISGAATLSFDFSPPPSWTRSLAAFVMIAFLSVLPIKVFSSFEELQKQKNEIIGQGLRGYENLKKSDFIAASASFSSAKKTIEDLGFVFNYLLAVFPGWGQNLNSGRHLLMLGEQLASVANLFTEALKFFDREALPSDKIKHLELKLREAVPHLLLADRLLKDLEGNAQALPIDIKLLRDALRESTKAILIFNDFYPTLQELLGEKNFKRYLFVFQNNNEIRPTGGFIGSFALIDVDRGRLQQMEVPGGGSYDIQGQLKELVISPEPFHLINSRWEFQDANWFPDFPASAKKLMWFYEKSSGSSVDGVIALNASLVKEFLALVGPIEMPEYDRTITAENFIDETQKIVELEYDRTRNRPKQFIADLAPKLLERLFKIGDKQVIRFSEIILKAILEKDFFVYSADPDIENKLASFGLAGDLKNSSLFDDYLMLVDTNIAGQKTDEKIIKNIEHLSEIDEDGKIINTVKITRRHTGVKRALFTGVRNVNYLRLYVPLGSRLISAEGFGAPPPELFKTPQDGYKPDEDLERIQGAVYVDPKTGTRINNEFGRTVFGNWIMVDPGEEAVIKLKYQLPRQLKINDAGLIGFWEEGNNFITYKMFIEKQPGAKNTTFKSYVKLKRGQSLARVGAGVSLDDGGWRYETELDTDKYYGVVLE